MEKANTGRKHVKPAAKHGRFQARSGRQRLATIVQACPSITDRKTDRKATPEPRNSDSNAPVLDPDGNVTARVRYDTHTASVEFEKLGAWHW